ncbi:hypothetical protein Csa_020215 [Cucumis sativus]|uniref:Uncharacterized protein n=1 Tax=Cucumis sativus TaxID=3659 RepID=A0A0A0K0Z8_CUCSA|nr:hypothetical protein Csa_020215 [Cucumis sativus]
MKFWRERWSSLAFPLKKPEKTQKLPLDMSFNFYSPHSFAQFLKLLGSRNSNALLGSVTDSLVCAEKS